MRISIGERVNCRSRAVDHQYWGFARKLDNGNYLFVRDGADEALDGRELKPCQIAIVGREITH